MIELENIIGYHFNNKDLLKEIVIETCKGLPNKK